jgi:flagellar hook assembly protein FlgD
MEWDGKNESGRSVGPGVYYLVVEKDGKSEKKKILVQR